MTVKELKQALQGMPDTYKLDVPLEFMIENRRVATRYDKLAETFLGVCLRHPVHPSPCLDDLQTRPSRNHLNMKQLKPVAYAIVAALAMLVGNLQAQQASHPTDSGFTFAVYGDSRSMMYLPYKSDQEADARQLMVAMFSLVLPEKVAAEIIKQGCQLIL